MSANFYPHKSPALLSECIRKLLGGATVARRGVLLLGASYALVSSPQLSAVELPIACVAGACGTASASPQSWVTRGTATATSSGNTLTINQSSEQVTLNWQSFNISADGKVIFSQPSTTSIALNRIFQASPSQIFGSIKTQLNSDPSKTGGQIYLVNPNGFIFGANSSVNAAGILVSTLGISDRIFQNGLLSSLGDNTAALTSDGRTNVLDLQGQEIKDANGQPIPVKIIIKQDANYDANGKLIPQMQAAANGRILLASQSIENAGTLSSPDGQIVLAAGDRVYLSASTDDSLRGLLVEVAGSEVGGTAWNQATGTLQADRGNVTMVGLAVNQDGRISASTSVSENGSIRLLARSSVDAPTRQSDASNVPTSWLSDRNGKVTLGANSVMDVSADLSDGATAVDDQKQLAPSVLIAGKQIVMKGGANITARGGDLVMLASTKPVQADDPKKLLDTDADARIRIDSGAVINLSGNDAQRSVSDNVVSVELRGTELADSPDQRNGVLRGQAVTVDARVGTGVADVSGAIAGIQKSVAERTSTGGTATLVSTGDIVTAKDATVDVSGGQITYTGGMVSTSQLITADGKLVDIGSAKEDVTYVGILSPSVAIKHDRWGVVEKVVQQVGSHYQAGYVQGSSAGTVAFQAPSLVLNGTLLGHATNGAYQRDPTATYANGNSIMAQGGQLIIGRNDIGPDLRAPAITLRSNSPNVVVSDESALPLDTELTLSTDFLTSGGFTRTRLYSSDTVTLAANTPLNLLDGSSLTVRASQININSSITDRSGNLDFANTATTKFLTGGGVNVAADVRLDVSGKWTNDTEVDNATRPTDTVFQNAGSISLATSGENSALAIGDGAQFLANGGAWLKSAGTISGGKGGSIALLSNGMQSSFALGDAVGLQGYGVNGAAGGKLSLSAGRVQIGVDGGWAAAQTYAPDLNGSGDYFKLGSSLFTDHGFSTFNLTASGGTTAAQGDALQVITTANINAVANTLQLSSLPTGFHSGEDIAKFSAVKTLPDYLRNNPASIRLSVAPNANYGGQTSAGTLAIQKGAVIGGDSGTGIELTSINGSIDIEGSLLAQAGSIDAHIIAPSSSSQTPNDPNLKITVGSSARLDASGNVLMTPNDLGLLQGKITSGGTVSLIADRGSVLIENGGAIDVSGTSAALDIATTRGSAAYVRKQVASNAGEIDLTAAESIGIYGDIRAHAGIGNTGLAAGGTLSITLTRDNATTTNVVDSFSQGERIVALTDDALPTATGTLVAGLASISVAQVQQFGLDDLRLAARDEDQRFSADEAVRVDAGVNLNLQRRLEIDAPSLVILGDGAATLNAGYVSLGSSLGTTTTIASSGGNGILNINADSIDLLGSSAWKNIGTANLVSGGDLRLRGTTRQDQTLIGDLSVAGDLNVQASRVYASTASQFTIDATGHTVDIEQGAASPGVPLSAASALTILASDIHQNGTVLAPYGAISLQASHDLTLGAHSLTSVSAASAVIPYGFTDSNGKNWFYESSSTPVTGVPERVVTLQGASVDMAAGSTVDLSGGGDLYSYEWVKGTGGTNDAFGFKTDAQGNATATLTNPGLYAVIPALGTQLAPYDKQEANVASAQGLQAGDTIYLSGGGGLAAGYYTLLPARYALLTGAYLVNAVNGYNNIQAGAVASLADGTPVVAGYRSFNDTGIGGTSYSGFAIYSGSWGRQLAEYKDTYASSFFADSAHNTIDAGRLSIITGNQLLANGTVNSRAAAGGQAATIDVSASNLEIVGTIGTGSTGVVQLDDDVLNGWHAGRLLLGGSHTDDNTIEVAADTVTVAGDAHLVGDEVTLTARDQVAIEAGGSVKSNSAVDNRAITLPKTATLTLTGLGADRAAVVAVSDIDNFNLVRDIDAITGSHGAVSIDAGAQLTTRGQVLVDAPGGAVIDGTLGGTGASWSLGSSHIVFADDSTPNGQLTITSSVLDAMQLASAVNLTSTGSIDFTHYSSNVSNVIKLGSSGSPLTSIELKAAAINNQSNIDSVEMHANAISLKGVADASSIPAATAGSQGSLTLVAGTVSIADHALALNGFKEANLNAAQQLSVSESGTMAVGGDLNIVAARITAAGSSNGVLYATGDVQLSQANVSSSLPPLELGGALSIIGNNISDNAQIIAPSGIVSLSAANNLILDSVAMIDVAGASVYASGVRADSNGGVIKLSARQNLIAATGSVLSVAGSGDADAGSISVKAGGDVDIESTLNAAASETATGGAFVLNAGRLTDFAHLNAALQTAGFTAKQSVNVMHGDLVVANDTTQNINAHDVQLVTDDGAITIAGTISAPSTQDRGSIRLYGADGVTLAPTGALLANGDATSGRGGVIEIGVSTDTVAHANASIDLQAGSTIQTIGAEPGRVSLRAPVVTNANESIASSAIGNEVAITALNADLSKAGTVTIEAVLPIVFDATLSDAKDDATAYIAAANGNVQARLNPSNNANVMLSPGIDVFNDGDIDLDALDLSSWRFNGTTTAATTPVVLTVRATGSLNVNGTISDGFTTPTTGPVSQRFTSATNDASATLRLVAGSAGSVDPLAVNDAASANLTLLDNVIIRTGSGDLSLVSAGDVVFNSGAGAYTGGVNAITTTNATKFLTHGGRLLINAGHDVLGYALADSVTAWQPRTGCVSACGSLTTDQRLTSWGINIQQFLWNVGTLGGGDLTITAGNDITNLSAAVADSAKENADKTAMTHYDGGSLQMNAGKNINSGMVYVGNSVGAIEAGGAVTSSQWIDDSRGLLIAMSDSQVNVNARNGVVLEGIVNPTMLNQPASTGKQAYFFSYGDDSLVAVKSTNGDVDLLQSEASFQPFFGSDVEVASLAVLPTNFSVKALSGSVNEGSADSGIMFPASHGQLTIFAGTDINNLHVAMSDAELSSYTELSPSFESSIPGGSPGGIDTRLSSGGKTRAAIHKDDVSPVSVAAGRDISESNFEVAKAIYVGAGRDIVNTSIVAQNVNAEDISEIVAGRDIAYTSQAGQIAIGGAGYLDISAGRNIDLGTSFGITTTGRLNNASLRSESGADVTVLSGMGVAFDADGFIDDIVLKSAAGSQALISFVQNKTGMTGLTMDQALTTFRALSVEEQRPFVLNQFFSELVLSGHEANTDATKGYSRGYAAVDALFPNSRDVDASPYSGDINMLYSRIYTLSGGNISLLAPGGSLNVGVAAKPLNSQFKEPGNLGVVAQGAGGVYVFTNNDVLVNSSRIFTLGGGDIAVWSTVGNIDAGKGAKTSLSIPPPSTTVDSQGNVTLNLTGAVSGSGIRTIHQTDSTSKAGNVDLIAPAGFVNAGDAGIGSAGNINIAARQVIGADNINFAGNATGVPAETSGIGASLSGAAAVGGSNDNSTGKPISDENRDRPEEKAPIAQAALSWLEVFVTGLGEDNCKQDDVDCLKRQK